MDWRAIKEGYHPYLPEVLLPMFAVLIARDGHQTQAILSGVVALFVDPLG